MFLSINWAWTRCCQRSLAWVSMSLFLVVYWFKLSFPEIIYWKFKARGNPPLCFYGILYIVLSYLLPHSIIIIHLLVWNATINLWVHEDQGFWRLANRLFILNKSLSDYICNGIELQNINDIKITDNSVLTRIFSLLWNICNVLQYYKTFTKSRCREVRWSHHSDVWNVQNSLSLFGNWDHMSALISWFRDIDYFQQGCIINSLPKSRSRKEYLN